MEVLSLPRGTPCRIESILEVSRRRPSLCSSGEPGKGLAGSERERERGMVDGAGGGGGGRGLGTGMRCLSTG